MRLPRTLLEQYLAEGVGFEPTIPIRYNGFQDRRIRPLCHPSWPFAHPGNLQSPLSPDVKPKQGFFRAFSFSCLVGKAHHVESFAEMGIVAA